MQQLTPEQRKVLGMQNLDEQQTVALSQKIGRNIFARALAELLETFSDHELATFDVFAEQAGDLETILQHLSTHHPEFKILLTKHERAFVEDCKKELQTM